MKFIIRRGIGIDTVEMNCSRSSGSLVRVLYGYVTLLLFISKNKRVTKLLWALFLVFVSLLSPHPWSWILITTHCWVQLWRLRQWSCWNQWTGAAGFLLRTRSNFHTFLVLYFTPLCSVTLVRSDSWSAAEGTKFTHFEKCRKSMYLTCEPPAPPAFLWADIDNGTLWDLYILLLIWSLSNKTVASFSF